MERERSSIGRVLMWEYARGSWQYDVLCGLIVLFIALTPREFFRRNSPPPPEQKSVQSEVSSVGDGPSWFRSLRLP